MNARLLLLIALVLGSATLVCPALADTAIWSTYHYDSCRGGQNSNSKDIKTPNGPDTLNMIWVFPRLGDDDGTTEANNRIVNNDDASFFTYSGRWSTGTDDTAYKTDYLYRPVVLTDTAPFATWKFPAGRIPNGKYMVYVWVPKSGITDTTSPLHTSATANATYTITDDNGSKTVVFDQTEGGSWQALSSDYYSFTNTGSVSVTSKVPDTDGTGEPPDEIVLADAIKFVPATGQEIYSSPASADLDKVVLPDPDDSTKSDVWNSAGTCVYTTTVEPALSFIDDGQTQTRDSGAVYCVYGVTPTLQDPNSDTSGLSDTDKERYLKIAKYLGKPKWRYPNADPSSRKPIEGPIDGGIYSSPTLALVSAGAGGKTKLVCFVTGGDRQLYCLDANTGELIWKGPGVTLPEDDSPNNPAWSVTTGRADAFGGSFHYIECVDSTSGSPTTTPCEWDYSDTDRGFSQPNGVEGLSYAVYAWLPGPGGTGDKERSTGAVYEITYAGTSGDETATVQVDQSSVENMGAWVRIGSSYFNPKKVVLKNLVNPTTSTTSSASKASAAGAKPMAVGASDYVVVADAIMIVPDTVEGLGYNSPVTDAAASTISSDSIATHVYCMTVNGRALGFDVGQKTKYQAQMIWAYPSIRTKAKPGPSEVDQPDWGEIGASPAYSANKLYITTVDGTIRCLKDVQGDNPSEAWTAFKTQDDTDDVIEGFTSSPCLDENAHRLYVGASSGIFYCIDMNTGKLVWQNPAADPDSATSGSTTLSPPFGAFRYSTPAVGIATYNGGSKRVWCGSSDGHIYSFMADSGERLYTDDNGSKVNSTGPYYCEPSLLNAIQGSVALDGASVSGNSAMYVGDMNGTLHWRDADNGSTDAWSYEGYTTPDMLFSSPNITNTTIGTTPVSWLYIGCGDGHMLAFTRLHGGWGGEWQGGTWPFTGDAHNQQANKTTAAPETDIQFDIFNDNFASNSISANPEQTISSWPSDFIVSKAMKELTPSSSWTTCKDVDDELTRVAKLQRQWKYLADYNSNLSSAPTALRDPSATDRNSLFFEWGQNINVIIWNLPESKYLYGGTSNVSDAITIYMTNASSGSSAGSQYKAKISSLKNYTVMDSTASAPYIYPSIGAKAGDVVKRSYAVAKIELDGTSTTPPSPGPGWVMSATIRKKDSDATSAPVTSITIPLAKLTSATDTTGSTTTKYYKPKMKSTTASTVVGVDTSQFIEASVGINNPIGIRDDGYNGTSTNTPQAIGWGTYSGGLITPIDQSTTAADDTHLNGNYKWTSTSVTSSNTTGYNYVPIQPTPTLYMDAVAHGTSSREASLGIVDRSAEGFNGKQLTRFMIDSNDLRFRDWPNAVERADPGTGVGTVEYGFKFPWDFGQSSVDYPDIYRRYQTYQQLSSDKDASTTQCPMLGSIKNPSLTSGWLFPADAYLQPDTVLVSVDVPRFQPANISQDGYSRTMTAYIDSNGNKTFDNGNYVLGKPTTYQEAYRRFSVKLKVPPDPKIEVDEQLIDIGSTPHGLGDETTGSLAFSAYNPNPEIQQWFKKLTIKNAGNVNLHNIRINQVLGLLGDQASNAEALPGVAITSSLDPVPYPTFSVFADTSGPFASHGANCDGTDVNLGYTLSKPRVGDPDPTVMTIPDQRKWDVLETCKDQATNVLMSSGWFSNATDVKPLPVEVSVRVPLTQPIGTYQSYDQLHNTPYVAVFSDINSAGEIGPNVSNSNANDPIAMPSFQLKLKVKENQLTGGATPTTLPQIDYLASGGAPPDELPKVGDVTPAAFRDAADDKLNVHLFWSSNRFNDGSLSNGVSSEKFASAPWFINHATLAYDTSTKNWKTDDLLHWWNVPNARIPNSQWDVPSGGSLSGTNILPWNGGSASGTASVGGASSKSAKPSGSGGAPDKSGLYSVKHFSPCIGENHAVSRTSGTNRDWLAWAGSADTKDSATNKIDEQHLIFYTDVTHGVDSSDRKIWAIEHDTAMAKRSPCPVSEGNNMWMFWQGGVSGNWSIYYSWSNGGPTFDTTASSWSPDMKLRTPDCMASVGSPNPLLRHLWTDMRSNTPTDFVDGWGPVLAKNSTELLDVVYSGTNKLTHNSDIILSRYCAVDPNAGSAYQKAAPSRLAQPLPRIFDEKLARDPKYGFYTSENLVWVRAERGKPTGTDHWGKYESDGSTINPDFPYIRVIFPKGYTDTTNGVTLEPNTEISATDGSVIVRDPKTGNVTSTIDPAVAITPDIDDATGIYTYSYTRPADYSGPNYADKVLGTMLVDFSSGIVRFTKSFKEVQDGSGSGAYIPAEVHADYTPQAWRLTTDPAADGSPRAFIEHTSMMGKGSNGPAVNGLDPKWTTGKAAPVDRLWVFWRRAGTAVDSSSIFYKTMRIGVDLATLGAGPVPMDPDSGTIGNTAIPNPNLTVNNALGPWQVDRTGTKIYFSEVDERYRSMTTPQNAAALGTKPDSIQISYKDINGKSVSVTADDVSWITEMPEQSLAFATDTSVNEGSIYAFADPQPDESGTSIRVLASKIWVFWTSTRGGNSDLYWETICPNVWAAR